MVFSSTKIQELSKAESHCRLPAHHTELRNPRAHTLGQRVRGTLQRGTAVGAALFLLLLRHLPWLWAGGKAVLDGTFVCTHRAALSQPISFWMMGASTDITSIRRTAARLKEEEGCLAIFGMWGTAACCLLSQVRKGTGWNRRSKLS